VQNEMAKPQFITVNADAIAVRKIIGHVGRK
jgi:hypothetical protein